MAVVLICPFVLAGKKQPYMSSERRIYLHSSEATLLVRFRQGKYLVRLGYGSGLNHSITSVSSVTIVPTLPE